MKLLTALLLLTLVVLSRDSPWFIGNQLITESAAQEIIDEYLISTRERIISPEDCENCRQLICGYWLNQQRQQIERAIESGMNTIAIAHLIKQQ